MPRLGPGPAIGISHIRTSPCVASSKPAAMRSNVDLPQPDAPIRQMNSPFLTRRLAPRKASIDRPFCEKVLPTFFISRIGIVASAMRRAPGQEPPSDQHYQLIGKKTESADYDHARYHDLGARELTGLHDDGAEAGLHAGHFADDDHDPGKPQSEPHAREDGRQRGRQHDAEK